MTNNNLKLWVVGPNYYIAETTDDALDMFNEYLREIGENPHEYQETPYLFKDGRMNASFTYNNWLVDGVETEVTLNVIDWITLLGGGFVASTEY